MKTFDTLVRVLTFSIVSLTFVMISIAADTCNCTYKSADRVCSDGWDPTAWCSGKAGNATACVGEGAKDGAAGTAKGDECMPGGGAADHCTEKNDMDCLKKHACVLDPATQKCKSGAQGNTFIKDGGEAVTGGSCVQNPNCGGA